jgi:hypothetical protein
MALEMALDEDPHAIINRACCEDFRVAFTTIAHIAAERHETSH